MSNKAEHTPTPWKIDRRDGHSYGPRDVIVPEKTELADRIAVVSVNGVRDGRIAKANANYIVDCANTHDTLVKQRDDLIEVLESIIAQCKQEEKL